MYLTDRPYLKKQMSFNEYYQTSKPRNAEAKYDKRAEEDIMSEILPLMKG